MNAIKILSRLSKGSHQRALQSIQVATWLQRNCSTKTSTEDVKYDDGIKKTILTSAMPHVIELGWSKEALVKGAESIGYPGVAHGLFPRGGAELIQHFYSDCNQNLAAKLKKEVEENSKIIPTDFVRDAVETRLRMIIPYLPRWPQALAIMSLPPNVPHTLASLLTLVDDICYYAGDRSVDFTWYARRVALGGVYKATELYLIQDQSKDYDQTWEFLTRRLDELFQIQLALNQSGTINQHAKDTVSSAFTTARNILGISWSR